MGVHWGNITIIRIVVQPILGAKIVPIRALYDKIMKLGRVILESIGENLQSTVPGGILDFRLSTMTAIFEDGCHQKINLSISSSP